MLIKNAIKEYLFECEIKKYTWKTIRGYKNALGFLANYLERAEKITDIENVTPLSIKQFINYQQKKKCKGTYINGLIRMFKPFFNYVVDERYIMSSPMLKISKTKEDKTLIQSFTTIEVKNMLSAFNEYDYLSVRNKAIIALLFDTGIRCYELCCLKQSDIFDSYIRIFGKGNKERIVPKSIYLQKMLFKYEQARHSYFEDKITLPTSYFLSRTGRPLTNSAVENIVTRAGKIANVSETIRCSPHTCRHTFAQLQLKNGLGIYDLMLLMGHTDVKITQVYLESLNNKDILKKSLKSSPLMNL